MDDNCPHCGAATDPEEDVCPVCGLSPNDWHCPCCETENDSGAWPICANCGHDAQVPCEQSAEQERI
jgi:hypothetical protein